MTLLTELEYLITVTAAEEAAEDEGAQFTDEGDAVGRLMEFVLEEYGAQPPEVWRAIDAALNRARLHSPRGPSGRA